MKRGEVKAFYGYFKLSNGGYGFEVMSRNDIDSYAREYSPIFQGLQCLAVLDNRKDTD